MIVKCIVTVNSHEHYSDIAEPDQPKDQPMKLVPTEIVSRPVTKDTNDLHKDIPIIIWWAEQLCLVDGIKELHCHSGSTCYTTKDRKHMTDKRTRGFYFYGSDVDPRDLPLPRKATHEWALLHEESPMNNYMLSHGTMIKLFNHTATFKRESDFPLTTQHIPDDLLYLTGRLAIPTDLKNIYRKEGLAPIVYVQSHCDIASDRDRYIKQLMKYIQVDSYGKCLSNKAIPADMSDPVESMEAENFLSFISKYKFQLSFENAICNDYMTEKLFRPLHIGSVPIYKGSPKVKDWMPTERAIILIDDFDSPKALAEYITHLDNTDIEYDKYLEFKTDTITNENLVHSMEQRTWAANHDYKPNMLQDFECYVCDKLVERYNVEKAHHKDPAIDLLPPKMASSSHLSCPQPYPSFGDVTELSSKDR